MQHVERALAVASRTAQTTITVFDIDWNVLLQFQSFRFSQYYDRLQALSPRVAHAIAGSPEHTATASGMLPGRI